MLETLQTHFGGLSDLVVLRIDASRFGEALRWEPSRDGKLFPHLYGPLPVSAVLEVIPVSNDDGDRLWLSLEPKSGSASKK